MATSTLMATTVPALLSASTLPRARRLSSGKSGVTLFAVFSDKSVLAQQDNLPALTLGGARRTRWTWTVVSTEGFSGTPLFWVTHPNSDDTTTAKLHWSGIDNQDWEHGREGTVTIEALPADAAMGKRVLKVPVAIRSIDRKDLTFFTPGTVHRVSACKAAAYDRRRQYSFRLFPPDQADGFPLPLVRGKASGTHVDVQLTPGGHFTEPQDSWLDLIVTDGGSESRLRMRVGTRPLREARDGTLLGERPLSFVRGQPLALAIAGEPSSPAGFSWEVAGFDAAKFKLEPAFKPMGRGPSAALEIDGLSDWDWINGTTGAASLVVGDGRREPVNLPFTFALEPVTMRFALAEGTKLVGPAGEALEIAEDGEFEPVIDRSDPDHPVIRLEGVEVRSVSPGAGANMEGGSKLAFQDEIPLLGEATVGPNGLNLGDDDESDDELRDRVRVLWAYPPAHGNRSHVLKIAEQVEGVDRAFVYPSLALDGLNGLGRVGCALVAPGRRCGVGRDSALAREVLEKLRAQGSFTADYVMMDVDHVGEVDPDTGKGMCQVDVDIQLDLADPTAWRWRAALNPVIGSMPDDRTIVVFHDPRDPERTAKIDTALAALADGDQLYLLGRPVTVAAIDNARRTLHLAGPVVEEDGAPLRREALVGERLYPTCPLRPAIEKELDALFKTLGTSEAPPPGDELPIQRRFPPVAFRNPDELKIAEIVNRLMDVEGVRDLRVVSPAANVRPPPNDAWTADSGERRYRARILSLRRVALGPLRPTPGLDAARGYVGPRG